MRALVLRAPGPIEARPLIAQAATRTRTSPGRPRRTCPSRPAITPFALGEANQALALLKQGGLTGSGVLVPDRI
jgi:hypothetical protein